jgi:homocitrate synthase
MSVPFAFRNYRPRGLEIIDTTLRDGTQSPLLHDHFKYFFSTDDKVEVARALIEYGVKFIELFAPTVSPQEAADFEVIRQARDELVVQKGYTFLLAHVRTHPADVDAAVKAGFDGLNFYMGTSEQSRAHNHGRDLAGIAASARGLLEDIRRNHPQLVLRFSGEDAFRTSESDLFRVYDEVADSVDRFGTPDTAGRDRRCEREVRPCVRATSCELEGRFTTTVVSLINALEAHAGMRYEHARSLGFAAGGSPA